MKKFYSILALATLGASTCFASIPAKHQITVSEKLSATERVLPAAPMTKHVAKAPAAKASSLSARDIAGSYVLQAFNATSGSTAGFRTFSVSPIQYVNDSQVNILGFWVGSDSEGNPYGTIAATYDQATGNLTIPCGPIGKVNGTTYYLYYQGWKDYKIVDQPLVLKQDGNNFYWMEETWAKGGSPAYNYIITDEAHKVGDIVEEGFGFFLQIEMNKFNTVQLIGDLDDPTTVPAWVEKTEKGFLVDNFGSISFNLPIEFTIDKANSTCSAPKVLYGEDLALNSDGSIRSDVYIASPNGGDLSGAYQVSEEDGEVSTIVGFQPFALYSPTVAQLAQQNTISSCYLLLNFDVTAAIKAVSVEDADAPAVYYNLQGVRVENPTSGIVIRVQGGKATKMLVK